MAKDKTIKRPLITGHVIGSAKAEKFGLIEGIKLNDDSAKLLKRLKRQGLKGDALCDAITRHFQKKYGA